RVTGQIRGQRQEDRRRPERVDNRQQRAQREQDGIRVEKELAFHASLSAPARQRTPPGPLHVQPSAGRSIFFRCRRYSDGSRGGLPVRITVSPGLRVVRVMPCWMRRLGLAHSAPYFAIAPLLSGADT